MYTSPVPDMNPIEHLWNEMLRRIAKRHLINKTENKLALQDACNNTEYIKTYLDKMPCMDRFLAFNF